jgi:hypothetical protein
LNPSLELVVPVDVGRAQGDLIVQVASADPRLLGIGFDLPEVGAIIALDGESSLTDIRFLCLPFFARQTALMAYLGRAPKVADLTSWCWISCAASSLNLP